MARTRIKRSPLHGRGLFAAKPFVAGEEIGKYPLLILSIDDTEALKATRVYHYVFHVDEDEAGQARAAIAFGQISMCNHSEAANAGFRVDAKREVVVLTARGPIAENGEITIDYEDFAPVALG